MSNQFQVLFLMVIVAAIAGTVRMRYLEARKTGKTRSSIVLRTYNDLWARFRIRVTWCFLPATAIALYLWLVRNDLSTCILTIIVVTCITLGGALFDHCLLRAWAKNRPAFMDEEQR